MKKIILGLTCIGLLFSTLSAQKHLIFMDGEIGWKQSMPPYLSEHIEKVEKLPFSGFVVLGNTYTHYTMGMNSKISYQQVWNEVKSLKNIFKTKKDNFLRINLNFPGDFWDNDAWNQTTQNFTAVAKAAKDLGFKGILFDDEVYISKVNPKGNFLSNFKFPKREDVKKHPERYEDWEIKESKTNRGNWMDYGNAYDSYRNPKYTFKEHMDKVASRFKTIMQSMANVFPNMDFIVLHGPATAHPKTNVAGHYIKPNSVYETNEYKGAMFLGFKQGLAKNAKLHDMGEFYKYNTDEQFINAYQWRKHDIVSEQYNSMLDNSFQWVVPKDQRDSWSTDVQVGFMVSDYGLEDKAHLEYNIPYACTPSDVESRLNKALKYSDNYVIFYSDGRNIVDGKKKNRCEDGLRWADVDNQPNITDEWRNTMQDVYDSIATKPLKVSNIHPQNIQEKSAQIFWEVSDYSTGQVEYGKTTAYGTLNKKETSFQYNKHRQMLPNLEAGTTYHYRVISEDKSGKKTVSKDYTFKTNQTKEAVKPIKQTYEANEVVSVDVQALSGNRDWVAIYRKGDNNSWGNVIAWNWVTKSGKTSLSKIKKNMPAGEYEVRLFFNNSYIDEAKYGFSVSGVVPVINYEDYGLYTVVRTDISSRISIYKPKKDGVIKQNSPVVIVSTGGWSGTGKSLETFINFIVSKGYFVIGVGTSSDREAEFNRILETLNNQGDLVDKSKIGLIGSSTGGGAIFYNLKRLKDEAYANNSFAISLDGWFALGLTSAEVRGLKTTTLLLQFGGADGLRHNGTETVNPKLGDNDHYQDPRILMSIYNMLPGNEKSLSFLDNNTHGYAGGSMNGKKDMLRVIGAMLAYKFENGGEAAKNVALNNHKYDEIDAAKLKMGKYRYGCTQKIYTSDTQEQNFDYCNVNNPLGPIVPR